jgi:hypothetical protein
MSDFAQTLTGYVDASKTPFEKVVGIVAYDEPTELVNQYAAYTLTANGVTQPGGGG